MYYAAHNIDCTVLHGVYFGNYKHCHANIMSKPNPVYCILYVYVCKLSFNANIVYLHNPLKKDKIKYELKKKK